MLVWGHDLAPARILVAEAVLHYEKFPKLLMWDSNLGLRLSHVLLVSCTSNLVACLLALPRSFPECWTSASWIPLPLDVIGRGNPMIRQS
jgi:hypothetical protein